MRKALKQFATDDYAAMSVDDRKAKFCNIASNSFSLKMLNGEEDDTYMSLPKTKNLGLGD